MKLSSQFSIPVMGSMVEYVQNLWPFSIFRFNDLRASDIIVKELPIPESTKHFVYAVREPKSQSVIYILSVQNLSERSALDVECLVRQIKPDAVVVQVGRMNNCDVNDLLKGVTELTQNGGKSTGSNVLVGEFTVPTSSFEVLKNCFMHKMNREKYEEMAGNLVLREIFGVSFNAHFVAAKKAAVEVGSSFFMLESPFVKCSTSGDSESNMDMESEDLTLENAFQSVLGLQPSNFVSLKLGKSLIPMDTMVFCVKDDIQSQMVKSLSSYLVPSDLVSNSKSVNALPLVDYEVPQFAKSVYPLLSDLHDIFADIPSMGNALACAQKMLCDVNTGKTVDTEILSEVYAFQIAVEGLRIALNNAGKLTMGKIGNSCKSEFSELPVEDKSHAMLAQALRSQTKYYKSIVAVVDASGLAGLRKHWNTSIPPEVENMVEHLVTNFGDDCESQTKRKRLLADKPVVAVGAGATAIIGASFISKVVPASTFVKIATFYVPSSLKLLLTQTQKVVLFAFGKGVGPAKIGSGMAGSTFKGSVFKSAISAEKLRLVAHNVIASAEKTSLSAMRTAFYEIMRTRGVRPVGILLWATFGCSIATCSGLLMYGDGIECAAESFPVAPMIASLGRGMQSLHKASQVVKQTEKTRIQKSIESLMYKFKNKIQ